MCVYTLWKIQEKERKRQMKKKIVSILLACCMTFGGSISAMAAEPNQNIVTAALRKIPGMKKIL